MSTDDPLTPEVFVIDPAQALHDAMHNNDPKAGFAVAVLYQALLRTLDSLLDEYEHEPDEFYRQVAALLHDVGGNDASPTIN